MSGFTGRPGSAHRRGSRRGAGFTMVETVVAILVVGIVVSSILLSISNYSRLTRIETLGEAALARCQEKMEQIRGLTYDQVVASAFPLEDGDTAVLLDSRGTADPSDDIYGTRRVDIQEITQGGDNNNRVKIITVTFDYRVRGGYTEETLPETYSESLTTIISVVR